MLRFTMCAAVLIGGTGALILVNPLFAVGVGCCALGAVIVWGW